MEDFVAQEQSGEEAMQKMRTLIQQRKIELEKKKRR